MIEYGTVGKQSGVCFDPLEGRERHVPDLSQHFQDREVPGMKPFFHLSNVAVNRHRFVEVHVTPS